ncbi:carbon monoxide dehydrogenase, FAD-binding subunit [Desulfuromonas soudanensis]|uniref:Carbon monoxide dehydrogenase, FAD-binding subunit n=1 Tax=Desulfuromonas soudanensis TaxID=1603606 RepID=A0A0M4D947_9BACT|nr:xanthine dehydrogenase family protein subunit M [Desulfuromonas soudanensis]ALC16392.1 carbon monoxide dehydrogenase, FAD-binding subunit [Desulfuromonas soudanensis]
MLPNFNYFRPDTLKEAIRELQSPGALLHSGGTDLLGCLHDGVLTAEKLISLTALTELSGIGSTSDGGRRLGALTTITALAANGDLDKNYPGLVQAAASVASPQLRNQGTLGGNLCQKPRCWYYRGEFDCLRKGGPKCYAVAGQNQFHCLLGGSQCYIVHPSDPAAALLALDARVEIAGPGGKRTVAVENFHVPPQKDPHRETFLEEGEIVTAVLLPPPQSGRRSSYRKVRARQSWDFAVAGVALALQINGDIVSDSRVVLSGAAPVPWRSKMAEEALRGRTLDSRSARAAAEAAMAEARPLAHNGYKVPLFKGLIEDELLKLAG